jgi:uncharacterized protein YecE (DUF72 family)
VRSSGRLRWNESLMSDTTKSRHPILIGCSGWSYPDWVGSFYPNDLPSSAHLDWYARKFQFVEVDSTFYGTPSVRTIRNWRDRTPPDFQFMLKVPRRITHDALLRDCRDDVEEFVTAIAPLGEKLRGALLQMGYFNQKVFRTFEEFLNVIDAFLDEWPHATVPLAVEIGNPRWIGRPLADVLQSHRTALTLTVQRWMPTPSEVIERIDPITGPFSVVRLIGDHETMEQITTHWDRIVIDRSGELAKIAQIIELLAGRVPVVVSVNNHYAGHAPATARQLRGLLGISEATVPS